MCRRAPLVCILLVLVAAAGVSTPAQEPSAAPPALSEVELLRIQALELTLENLSLRLDAVRREADGYLRTLQRPGFELVKVPDAQGVLRWAYRPAAEGSRP